MSCRSYDICHFCTIFYHKSSVQLVFCCLFFDTWCAPDGNHRTSLDTPSPLAKLNCFAAFAVVPLPSTKSNRHYNLSKTKKPLNIFVKRFLHFGLIHGYIMLSFPWVDLSSKHFAFNFFRFNEVFNNMVT